MPERSQLLGLNIKCIVRLPDICVINFAAIRLNKQSIDFNKEKDMKLRVTHKVLLGYLAVFVLLCAFAALTIFNGKRIEATTVAVAQEKIPGLIAVSGFKSNLQLQTNHLYELYATNDFAAFSKRNQDNKVMMQAQLTALQKLPEFKSHEALLTEMSAKQIVLTEKFVQVMRAPEVDWDNARTVLSDFSKVSDTIAAELDTVVQTVANKTLSQADESQKLTEQLMNWVLWLTAAAFIGIVAMAYYSHRQVSAPLSAVSASLADIATRKDLTYRVKVHSDDEVGEIAVATNRLLAEFQALTRTLDGTAQEINRTTGSLTQVTEANIKDLPGIALKLKNLADNLHGQIKVLNF